MKLIVLASMLFTMMFSCKQEVKNIDDSGSPEVLTVQKFAKSKINFDSHPIAERYKTVINEKYEELDINFASHYVVITWGGGSGCVTGAMVDVRDGNVYPMPEDQEWGGNGTYIDSNKENDLLTTALVIQTPSGKLEETRKYWKWDEQLKEFKFDKEETVEVDRK